MEPWETRHAGWRAQGNQCGECERERGLDDPSSHPVWRRILDVTRAHRRHGVQPAVLLGSALDPDGRHGLRDADLGSAPLPAGERSLSELKREAERIELRIEGNARRGPVQSVPAFVIEQARLETLAASLWTAYADKLFEEGVQAE